jgi:aspartate carbamoyltransferase catalytic subunit
MALLDELELWPGFLVPSLREYSRRFGLNAARVALAQPHVLVMHPGPMNEGVEIQPDVATGPNSVIETQVTNGVAMRMALLYQLAESN